MPRLSRLSQLLRTLYGLYAMAMFVIIVLILFCPLLIVAPTLPLRRGIGRLCVRLWLISIFIRFRIRGLENLPAGACIAVCNHASYLDGILLTAALPSRFTFLVQHGAADWPYVGLIIKRMGVMFVDRGSARAAARVTRELIDRLQRGDSIAIFPEGTFKAAPELRPFQAGAFLIAARAQVPVMPVVMRGTRYLFGAEQKLFRHSRVDIEYFPSLKADGESRGDAVMLHAQVRTVMLANCGEADGTLQTAEAG